MKFGETFCDWLIYETAHTHTIFNALTQTSNKYFFLDATPYGILTTHTKFERLVVKVNMFLGNIRMF